MTVSAGDEVQLVVFRIDERYFAFNVFQAERVLPYREPTPLPNAAEFLEGMLPYGDGSVPLIDMRKRLGAPAPLREETRIMVLELEQGKIGLVVDAVVEVKKVPAGAISMPPEIVRELAAEFISGILNVGGRTIVILAVSRLLSSAERVTLEDLMVEAGHE